jgi:hypothetical protein
MISVDALNLCLNAHVVEHAAKLINFCSIDRNVKKYFTGCFIF